MPHKLKRDLTGLRFGKLLVLGRALNKGKSTRWLCDCDCGRTVTVYGGKLHLGTQVSCSCHRNAQNRTQHITHGKSRSKEYSVWNTARGRCHNPTDQAYGNYGARGIYMCQEWRDGFAAFDRDMGPRPTSRHTLERIDNNGPYSPDNCCWATRKAQCQNRRFLRPVTIRGVTFPTVTAAAEHYGLGESTLRFRLNDGISPDEAVNRTARQKS